MTGCRARRSCSSERFYVRVPLASEDAALTLPFLEGEWEEKGVFGRTCQEYDSALGRRMKSSIGPAAFNGADLMRWTWANAYFIFLSSSGVVCMAALGLLLPANVVLSITLIRGWHLPDTKYFSFIFNTFLASPHSQCSQNLSSKTQQNPQKRKKKGKKQARWMPVWLVAGCRVWRLFPIGAYTARTCVRMDGIKYKGGGGALTLWI